MDTSHTLQSLRTPARALPVPAGRTLVRRLVVLTTVVTLILIMMGAWVRLTDAGLGCPDWPGCYGHLTPTRAADKIAAAVAEHPTGEHGPVSMGKAWREMIHRYVATFVGFLILVIAALSWRHRKTLGQTPWLAAALVGVVILQGLFGKWTVTLLLKPAIVTGHLMGGMLVFGMLVWLAGRQFAARTYVDPEPVAALRTLARVALLAVVAQIFLGGWTSTNYAALACTDLPTCRGSFLPEMDFREGFHLIRELGYTDDGALLPQTAMVAIHWSHRMGALVVTALVGWLAWRTLRTGERRLGQLLAGMLAVQLVLGLSNVWFSLPLWVAVAHNGGAALLVGLLVTLNLRAHRARLKV